MTGRVIFKDVTGKPVTLGTELGRGGEGAVYEVREHPGLVAKLYLSTPSRDHVSKLGAMLASANDRLLSLTAWPTNIVICGTQPIGFMMPRISGYRAAFELCGPKLRLQQFPKADWRFLIRAAANTARAFSVVHTAGHVIGDVNHRNLMVGQDATVRLIDCDSFQITQGRKTWFCEVGVGTHQPPEMQGRSFVGFTRTPNHDAFGLAVLIFQMLCLGRHPFAGRYLGGGEPPTIEDAIRHFRYAYGGDARMSLMTPPPGSLRMEALTPPIRQLFEQAFLQGGAWGARPSARQWADALSDLEGELRQCALSSSHYHLSNFPACPWCEIEARSGVALFPVVFVAGVGGADGFMLLWQQVEATQLPGPRSPMPDAPRVRPSPDAKVIGRRMRITWLTLGAALIGGWAVLSQLPELAWQTEAMVAYPFALVAVLFVLRWQFSRGLRRRVKESRAKWNALRQEWSATSPRHAATIRAGLDKLKGEYDALQTDRAARLRKLHENRRAGQIREYLDRFQITGAKIKGVGPAKAATLQSYSIETAADVEFSAVVAVPGFGPKTAQNLVVWRTHLERSFRFDPKRGVPPTEIAKVENLIGLQTRQLEQRLSAGLADLRTSTMHEKATRERLQAKFRIVAPLYGLALADSRAISAFIAR